MKAVILFLALAMAGAAFYWFSMQSPDTNGDAAEPASQTQAAPPVAERKQPPARYTPPPEMREIPPQVTHFTELSRALATRPDCQASGRVGEWLTSMRERAVQSSLDFAAAFGAQPSTDAYHAYDDQTLNELAAGGDSRAYMTLGHRASARGDTAAAQAAYRSATVLGEEDALGFLAYNLGRARDNAERSGDRAAIEKAVVEQLAWHRVQEKRMGVMYFRPTERWSEEYLLEDPELEAEATARGAELYQTLNQERLQQGLDVFEDFPATLTREQLQASLDCAED